MAHFNKVGLLLLSDDQKKFMVCTKDTVSAPFLFPGGQVEEGESDEHCLVREIMEELNVELNTTTLKYIGTYQDVAASDPNRDVVIRLYRGSIIDKPVPSQEIKAFYWITKDEQTHPRISPIMKNKIIPDLLKRNILK